MPKRAFAAAGLSIIAGLLASCGGTTDPAIVASERVAKSTEILNKRKQKGALILVRFLYPGLFGPVRSNGQIRLRKLIDGEPDKVAASEDVYSGFKWLLPEQSKPTDISGNLLNPVRNAKEYERVFDPIAPGTYVVTYASCQISRRTEPQRLRQAATMTACSAISAHWKVRARSPLAGPDCRRRLFPRPEDEISPRRGRSRSKRGRTRGHEGSAFESLFLHHVQEVRGISKLEI